MFNGRHHGQFHGGGGIGLIAFLICAALIVALIALAIYAVIRLTSHPRRGPFGRFGPGGPPSGPAAWLVPPPGAPPGRFGPDAAVEEVRLRYARGDLSRDDYFRLMSDLIGGPGAGEPGAGEPRAGGPPPPPPTDPGPPGPA